MAVTEIRSIRPGMGLMVLGLDKGTTSGASRWDALHRDSLRRDSAEPTTLVVLFLAGGSADPSVYFLHPTAAHRLTL